MLDRLTPDQRDVLLLRILADLTVEQVAEVVSGADAVVFLEDTHGDPDPYPGPAPVVISPDVFKLYDVIETPHAIALGADGQILGRTTLSARGQLGALAAALPG